MGHHRQGDAGKREHGERESLVRQPAFSHEMCATNLGSSFKTFFFQEEEDEESGKKQSKYSEAFYRATQSSGGPVKILPLSF